MLLLLCVSGGCVSSAGPRDALGWLEARGADAMDVIGVRVALGPGLGVHARATRYMALGAMWRGPTERELPHPKDGQLRSVPCFFFGTIGRYGGAWFESSSEYMLPGWSTRDADPLLIEREVIAGYVTPHGEADSWEQSFGVGAHLLLAGAEVEVRPWEVLDFVAGLIGYDPSSDDVPVDTSSRSADEDS
ncbi:MAG: hypothetical protein DHS20C15_16760 [Planctomycetota bacterium]|nr:MAG: hypothetical protein DHS20C15_16760 [Planctomycetota bacterium]